MPQVTSNIDSLLVSTDTNQSKAALKNLGAIVGDVGTTANLVMVTSVDGSLTPISRSGIDTRTSFPPASHTHGPLTQTGQMAGSLPNQVVIIGSDNIITTRSASGIDTRTDFPNNAVTAATTGGNIADANKLVRFNSSGFIPSTSISGLPTFGSMATQNTSNFVDITNAQTIGGLKTFSGGIATTGALNTSIRTGSTFELRTALGSITTIAHNATANRTITLPDATGTVALTNDSRLADVTAATSSGDFPNTLVRRNEVGQITLTSNEQETTTLLVTSGGDSDDQRPRAIFATASGNGGIAGEFISDNSTGVIAKSGAQTGLEAISINGTYHATFGIFGLSTYNNNRSAIERVRGWFVWFYNNVSGRLKTADITATREWTLPDATGTIALTNDSRLVEVSAATSSPTAGTIVKRDSDGAITLSSSYSGGITLDVSSNGNSDNVSAKAIKATATGATGIAGEFTSNTGKGVIAISGSSTALEAASTNGTYHATFGTLGDNRSAIERVRGWFVWFYGNFTGRLKTANITANRDWTLPNESGTIALTNDSRLGDVSAASTAAIANTLVRRGIDSDASFNAINIGSAANTGNYIFTPTIEDYVDDVPVTYNPTIVLTPAIAYNSNTTTITLPARNGTVLLNDDASVAAINDKIVKRTPNGDISGKRLIGTGVIIDEGTLSFEREVIVGNDTEVGVVILTCNNPIDNSAITITLPSHASGTVALEPVGPYANNAAAATGGVPIGQLYYNSSGAVFRRMP